MSRYGRHKAQRNNTLLKQSAGPIWQNTKQMTDVSLNLQEEAKSAIEKATRRSPVPEIRTLKDIRHRTDEPMYISVIDNTFHCCRLYFNSQKNVVFVSYLDKRTRTIWVSTQYPTLARARQAWDRQQVIWKTKKSVS